MKLRTLLEDEYGNQSIVDTLSPFHLALLKKVASGQFDPFATISDRTQQVADELVNLGFLDSGYGLTNNGQKAIRVASAIGGTADLKRERMKAAARRAIGRKEAPVPVDVELDDDDALDPMDTDEVAIDDEDLGGTLRTVKKKKPKVDRVRSLDRDAFTSFDKEDDLIDDDGDFKWD